MASKTARSKRPRPAAAAAAKTAETTSSPGAAAETPPQAAGTTAKPRRRSRGRTKTASRRTRRRVAAPRRAPRAKTVRRRVGRFSDARRQEILEIAAREGLTGAQVAKRFGISQVTYYLWRKKAGAAGRNRSASTASASGLIGGMEGTIRAQVRSAIEAMLPQLIEDEVAAALGGAERRGKRR